MDTPSMISTCVFLQVVAEGWKFCLICHTSSLLPYFCAKREDLKMVDLGDIQNLLIFEHLQMPFWPLKSLKNDATNCNIHFLKRHFLMNILSAHLSKSIDIKSRYRQECATHTDCKCAKMSLICTHYDIFSMWLLQLFLVLCPY